MYTLEDIRQAIAYNDEHELYAVDDEFMRVYFTYVGGKYNGQRGDVKSQAALDRLESEIQDGLQITDIDILTTAEGWQSIVPKEAK